MFTQTFHITATSSIIGVISDVDQVASSSLRGAAIVHSDRHAWFEGQIHSRRPPGFERVTGTLLD